jgi:hypothetical protein
VSLPSLYANAKCLKDDVYRGWIANLSQFVLDPDEEKAKEAARRIDYIEAELLGGAYA